MPPFRPLLLLAALGWLCWLSALALALFAAQAPGSPASEEQGMTPARLHLVVGLVGGLMALFAHLWLAIFGALASRVRFSAGDRGVGVESLAWGLMVVTSLVVAFLSGGAKATISSAVEAGAGSTHLVAAIVSAVVQAAALGRCALLQARLERW